MKPQPARALALEALTRIDEGAYANLVLPPLLDNSRLDRRDRAFATELVYGVTRMRRACDWLVDQFARGSLEQEVRNILRLGVYQLVWLHLPAHAAVSATVDLAPDRARGLVNGVLRSITRADPLPGFPDDATALSYPDWILDRLAADLGPAVGRAALETMNLAPQATVRADGYVQDQASQWVTDIVGVEPGETVVDLCAAPGGKATGLGAAGAGLVVAADVNETRVGLVVANAARLRLKNVRPVVADGRRPSLRAGRVDRVLVDAPCSGLGVLRRRPDARWRVGPEDVDQLADLQRALLQTALGLVRPGGVLVYSVCTMTATETIEIDSWLADTAPHAIALDPPMAPWRPHGRGALLLPQTAGTDGMFVLTLRLRDSHSGAG